LEGVGVNDRGGSTTAEAFVVAASAVDTKEKYSLQREPTLVLLTLA